MATQNCAVEWNSFQHPCVKLCFRLRSHSRSSSNDLYQTVTPLACDVKSCPCYRAMSDSGVKTDARDQERQSSSNGVLASAEKMDELRSFICNLSSLEKERARAMAKLLEREHFFVETAHWRQQFSARVRMYVQGNRFLPLLHAKSEILGKINLETTIFAGEYAFENEREDFGIRHLLDELELLHDTKSLAMPSICQIASYDLHSSLWRHDFVSRTLRSIRSSTPGASEAAIAELRERIEQEKLVDLPY